MALITLADFLIGAGGNGGGVADNTTQRASAAISKGSMAETGFAWERSFANFKQLIGWWGRGFRVMKSPESPGFEPQLGVTGGGVRRDEREGGQRAEAVSRQER